MTAPPPDPLFLAFEAAAGRAAGLEAPAPALLTFARRVLEAGRRVASLPRCPQAALRRAEALFVAGPRRGLAGLLRLLFDSWREPAPALRGRGARHRLLRFGQGPDLLDVEVEWLDDGRRVLRLAVAPGAGAGLRASVEVVGGTSQRVALDAAGVGRADLPAKAAAIRVVLRAGRRVRARTPEVVLDRP